MPFLPGFLLLTTLQGSQFQSRFQPGNPLPGLPPIVLDTQLSYQGPAKQVCSRYGLQARIMWIDATANIQRYNTVEKIQSLVARIKTAGFNTIVFDVKPLSSEMVYPSAFAPKLTEWKGNILGDFDPLGPMCAEARKNGLSIYVSMNAFCDGHRLVNRGPGFNRPDEQSVLYESKPIVNVNGHPFDYSATLDGKKITLFSAKPNDPSVYAIPCDRNGNMLADDVPLPKGGFYIAAPGFGGVNLAMLRTPNGKVSLESKDSFVRIGESTQDKQYPLMTSPTNPSVKRRLFDIAEEVVKNYDIDGIVYDDRLRYAGLSADFTPLAESLFQQHIGKRITWPDDVYKYTYSYTTQLNRGIKPGPYYDAWLNWRASILHDFVVDVRHHIRAIKPNMQLGVYAGSWYGDYQQYGNNWASPAMEAGFWFLTPEYQKTGFSPDIDFLITGCYYPTATGYDALVQGKGVGFTVESAGTLSYRAAHDQTFVYAGLSLSDFKDNPEGLGKALQAAVASSNGVMCFDLSHDIDPLWPVFEKAFAEPKISPNRTPGYLDEARRLRLGMDRKGIKEPPIIIAGGASGVGF
ncbi:MAG: family 10 glycosylhydrolase [Armatimonadetes bacterium]|nr:family 10 glycosylhydrolase [Armatimonadota bacterium]